MNPRAARLARLNAACAPLLASPSTPSLDEVAAYRLSVTLLTAAFHHDAPLVTALAKRQLDLLRFESLLGVPSAGSEAFVALMHVDRWIANFSQNKAARVLRVAWLVGRLCLALRVVGPGLEASSLPSPALVSAVGRALLAAGAAATGDNLAPLRAWAHLYVVDAASVAASGDGRAHVLVLLAAVRDVPDRLWAGAMALQLAAAVGDAAFYLRICEFMIRTFDPAFVAFAGVFSVADDAAAAGPGSTIVHLREPVIPRHNEPTPGFVGAVRRFSAFERRMLIGKRLQQAAAPGAGALPLLGPRLAAMAELVPLGDYRCWWLALLCVSAWQIGDTALLEAAKAQLRADLESAQLADGDALLAQAICDQIAES